MALSVGRAIFCRLFFNIHFSHFPGNQIAYFDGRKFHFTGNQIGAVTTGLQQVVYFGVLLWQQERGVCSGVRNFNMKRMKLVDKRNFFPVFFYFQETK